MRSALLLLIAVVLAGDLSRADNMRVASVDMRKIFDNWNYTIKTKEKLQVYKDSLVKENNDRLAVINNLKMMRSRMHRQFKVDGATMSDTEKNQMDKKFRDLGREGKALEQDRRDFFEKGKLRLASEESSMARVILDLIGQTIQAYSLAEKYDMVIEMGGSTTRNLPFFLHLEGAVDISDEIIGRLNENGTNDAP